VSGGTFLVLKNSNGQCFYFSPIFHTNNAKLLLFILKTLFIAGLEPKTFVPVADAVTTRPRRQGAV
jgi:hypothetical protein